MAKPARKSSSKPRVTRRWIAVGVLAVLGMAGLYWLPVARWLEGLRGWIDARGALGPVLFAALYIVAGLLFVPGAAMTLAAGAIFGLAWGTLLVSCASTTVAALSFLIARHLARKPIERRVRAHPRFAAIDHAIGESGWKFVLLLRLSPLVPFSFTNYLLGVTRIDFWPSLAASWLGMLPGTLLYVYLGHIGAAGISEREKSPWEWTLLAVGLVATFAIAFWVARIARRSLDRRWK